MRNEKGITLVALILIIVVLLILAGISIMLVVNNETDEKTPNNSLNQIVYDEKLFENAYNEYTNSLEEDIENETVTNESNADETDANTVSNTAELTNTATNEVANNV